jgi:hypothetical protein
MLRLALFLVELMEHEIGQGLRYEVVEFGMGADEFVVRKPHLVLVGG